jgi:hypothetical protein
MILYLNSNMISCMAGFTEFILAETWISMNWLHMSPKCNGIDGKGVEYHSVEPSGPKP